MRRFRTVTSWTSPDIHHRDADPAEALGLFEALRTSHLRLIGTLDESELARTGVHAERGEETVAHMIRLYAGHDLVHLNQIERILTTVSGS